PVNTRERQCFLELDEPLTFQTEPLFNIAQGVGKGAKVDFERCTSFLDRCRAARGNRALSEDGHHYRVVGGPARVRRGLRRYCRRGNEPGVRIARARFSSRGLVSRYVQHRKLSGPLEITFRR